jgi:hypothetical protein
MNRREKCRCISLVMIYLLGVASVVAMIYGGIHIFRVSKSAAEADGVSTQLSSFYKCSDVADAVPAGDYTLKSVQHAVVRQCIAGQLPARVVMGFAAGFMILALLCVPCAFKKDKWFGFTMWSTLAIGTILMSTIVVAIFTLPTAAKFADCRHMDQATITALGDYGFTCVRGPEYMPNKESALKWLCKLCTFFGGSAAAVVVLLLLFCVKSCKCCDPNAQGCCGGNNAQNGEPRCIIRRTFGRLRARFCRRPGLASSVDRDDGLPVSAPSYYEAPASPEASEGVVPEGNAQTPYYGVN